MKRFFLILLGVFLLAAVALAIFIATFNADRYRPIAIQKLEQAMGRPVGMEHLSLGWRGASLALEMKGLAIGEGVQSAGHPGVRIDQVGIQVRLLPLIKREVQIGRIYLNKPQLRLTIQPSGTIDVQGITPLTQPQPAPAASAPATNASQPPSAPKILPFVIKSLELRDGTVVILDQTTGQARELLLQQINGTLKDLSLIHPVEFELSLAALSNEPNVKVSGIAKGLASEPQGTFTMRVKGVPLKDLMPAQPGAPKLEGKLFVDFEGGFKGVGAKLAESLAGTGKLWVEEARLVDMNLLREVFDRLSILPGLTQTLLSRLPPDYQQKLQEKDTPIQKIASDLSAGGGTVSLSNLKVTTEMFELSGSGEYKLTGSLSLPAQIRINQDLTEAIIRSVEELKFLVDEQGHLLLPVIVQGNLPQVSAMPDVSYATSRLAAGKGQELLGGLLQKALGD